MLRTKIICTLGPACDDRKILKQLMLSGMSVARMNFSHGSREEHIARIKLFKETREEVGLPIALLMDNRGPEIRTGKFASGRVKLAAGDTFTLVPHAIAGDETRVSITYSDLYRDIAKGQRILIDDGLVELRADEVGAEAIVCTVINSGELGSTKGINIPGAKIRLPAMTPQDEDDVRFCVEQDFDYIAMSFVRSADDVRKMRRLLSQHGGGDIRIISKIENQEGVDNFDAILRNSDGIMVARGDLGMEIPVELVPPLQKDLIKKTTHLGKPVITATQMLDSMIRNPRPTRAEASDVANAIFDGTSVIMLSGETANGAYPVESLQTMVRIAQAAEDAIHYWKRFRNTEFDTSTTVSNAISHATCTVAMDLNASAIITVTKSGTTARFISRFRPSVPIVAATSEVRTLRQMMLSWGVLPILVPEVASDAELFSVSCDAALNAGHVKSGDVVVLTAGVPVGFSGTTNILKVEIVGDPMMKGRAVSGGTATGLVFVSGKNGEAPEDFARGGVLVASCVTPALLPVLRLASALVLEDDDPTGQAETAGAMLAIPVLVEAANATRLLRAGTLVTVDANNGQISLERGSR